MPIAHEHRYTVTIEWAGNRGPGTAGYRAYSRNHEISAAGKPTISGSSDPAFLGDGSRWNPEEMFVASLSACHKLWYLHLAADAGIIVTAYQDQAEGTMIETPEGSGRFTRVLLRPVVTVISEADVKRAAELHHVAHENCFLANSVTFPVDCEPKVVARG